MVVNKVMEPPAFVDAYVTNRQICQNLYYNDGTQIPVITGGFKGRVLDYLLVRRQRGLDKEWVKFQSIMPVLIEINTTYFETGGKATVTYFHLFEELNNLLGVRSPARFMSAVYSCVSTVLAKIMDNFFHNYNGVGKVSAADITMIQYLTLIERDFGCINCSNCSDYLTVTTTY